MKRAWGIWIGLAIALGAVDVHAEAVDASALGDSEHGAQLIEEKHCGACHVVPGVDGANGTVGPPLTGIARRQYIAGQLPNRPALLVRWLIDPPALVPRTAMPNLGLTIEQADDIAAYLYTLQ